MERDLITVSARAGIGPQGRLAEYLCPPADHQQAAGCLLGDWGRPRPSHGELAFTG